MIELIAMLTAAGAVGYGFGFLSGCLFSRDMQESCKEESP